MVSIVSEAPTPHSPPIATPYSARNMISTVRLGAKPDANSRIEYKRMSTIRVGRRPQRSAARPKMKAPIGRIASVSRIASVTFEMSVWNSAAISFSTNTSRKKSKASSDHPRKLAATTCFCSLVQPDSAAIAMRYASSEGKTSDVSERSWIVVWRWQAKRLNLAVGREQPCLRARPVFSRGHFSDGGAQVFHGADVASARRRKP